MTKTHFIKKKTLGKRQTFILNADGHVVISKFTTRLFVKYAIDIIYDLLRLLNFRAIKKTL